MNKKLEKTLRLFIDNMAHIDLMTMDTRKACADDLIRKVEEMK